VVPAGELLLRAGWVPAAIRRIAFERHATESEVLREAVDAYLEAARSDED
jgi:hypothetical protein